MKIGFIGCGNMARSIIDGIIKANLFEKEEIFASAKDEQKLKNYCLQAGIQATTNEQIAIKCDLILLCVKPQIFPEILPNLKGYLQKNCLLISIAAGKSLESIAQMSEHKKCLRAMPSLSAAIGLSQTALCAGEDCSEAETMLVKRIFESIGDVYFIREEDFSAFSACACCSPAFSFMYIDALAKAAEQKGLDENIAYLAASRSVKASAVLLESSSLTPQALIERVCSPGGTTIEGVKKLQISSFEQLVGDAVNASYEKDKTMQ